MASEFGYDLPKGMHQQVGDFVNAKADKLGKELSPNEINNIFQDEFVKREFPIRLLSYKISPAEPDNENNKE